MSRQKRIELAAAAVLTVVLLGIWLTVLELAGTVPAALVSYALAGLVFVRMRPLLAFLDRF